MQTLKTYQKKKTVSSTRRKLWTECHDTKDYQNGRNPASGMVIMVEENEIQ